MQEVNKFRSSINSRYTQGLFFEMTGADKSTVLYTLKDVDHENFPSLYRLYMELEDVTEWEFANTYLDGWEHWQMICTASWFVEYVARWRQELELKLRSRALAAIRTEAASESKNAYYANKFLLEGGWKEKTATPVSNRGRPKKVVEKDTILEAEEKLKIKKDFERMSIEGTS